ncbi:hypothetical protein B566_EDAN012741 [Ephemera danica]|nr:hypothetical protein B566_EDAN012741 [Ephemera danica]
MNLTLWAAALQIAVVRVRRRCHWIRSFQLGHDGWQSLQSDTLISSSRKGTQSNKILSNSFSVFFADFFFMLIFFSIILTKIIIYQMQCSILYIGYIKHFFLFIIIYHAQMEFIIK